VKEDRIRNKSSILGKVRVPYRKDTARKIRKPIRAISILHTHQEDGDYPLKHFSLD